MIRAGIVGVPHSWKEDYRPVLDRLAGRVCVTAVYDSVPARAHSRADELSARAETGVVTLAEGTDVDALLVLDTGWQNWSLLPYLATLGKPVFLAGRPPGIETLEYLHTIVTLNRCLWIPAALDRFTPATSRLMELTATALGEPVAFDFQLPHSDRADDVRLARSIDWCSYVLRGGGTVQSVRVEDETTHVELNTAPLDGPDRTACIALRDAGADGSEQRTITCAEGTATISGPTEITWQAGEGEEPVVESLTSERGALDIQLAIFFRRAAGGLIPVADLSDLHRSLVAAGQIAAASTRPV